MFARGTKVWPSTLGRFVLFVHIFVSLVKKNVILAVLIIITARFPAYSFCDNIRKYHDVGFWPFMFHVQNVCQIFHRIPNPPGRPVVVLGGHFNPNQTFPDVSGKAFRSEGKRNKDEVRPAMLDARQFKNGVLIGEPSTNDFLRSGFTKSHHLPVDRRPWAEIICSYDK